MKITFEKLISPNSKIANTLNKWANDPLLIPLTRPNRNKKELEAQSVITMTSLTEILKHQFMYLIYVDNQLVGQMNFQMNFGHLYKTEPGTAWIGIALGESSLFRKGIGMKAMDYLEKQIYAEGLRRIELGVFSFNTPALKFYKKRGYLEIGRIEEFTLWQDQMWSDIRMEKYL